MNTPIKLKIALKDLPHKCERTLLVPSDINMLQFHIVIQQSFGWEDAHLFQFSDVKWKSNIRVGIPSDMDDDFGFAELSDAYKVSLHQAFVEQNEAKPFWYWYDFGDDWWHRISFLKLTQKDIKAYQGKPICIKAIGKCPPEDIGGIWGYANFLETINNKKDPEYAELREWFGLPKTITYDEMEEIHLPQINALLELFFTSKRWGKNTDQLYNYY